MTETTKNKAKIWNYSSIKFGVKFRYDSALIEEMKKEIPSAARKWDSSSKSWIIANFYKPAIEKVLKENDYLIEYKNPKEVSEVLLIQGLLQEKKDIQEENKGLYEEIRILEKKNERQQKRIKRLEDKIQSLMLENKHEQIGE
jgi:hypothetical protein